MPYRDLWRDQIWPVPFDFNQVTISTPGLAVASTATMDASGEKAAALIRVPADGTLEKTHWLIRDVVQWPTNGVRFSIQGLAASDWRPDGAITHFRNYVPGTAPPGFSWISPEALTTTGAAGGTRRSMNRREYLHVVMEFLNFASGDNIVSGGYETGNKFTVQKHRNIGAVFAGSAWSIVTSGRAQGLILEYTDGSLYSIGTPAYNGGSFKDITASSTPDEYGVRAQFSLPVRATGIWANLDTIPPAGNKFVVYDADGATLAEATVLEAHRHPNGILGPHFAWDTIDTLSIIGDGRVYRLVYKGVAGTGRVAALDYASAAHREINWNVDGTTIMGTQRTDAGAWTDLPLQMPLVSFVIDGVDPYENQVIARTTLRGSITETGP